MAVRKSKKQVNLVEEEQGDKREPASALDERIAGLESSIDTLTQLMGNLSSQIDQLNSYIELDLAAEKREEEIKKLRRADMRQRGLRFVALLYLTAMVFSVLMIVKPGAGIFFYKQTVESEKIEPGDDSYRYPLEINGLISPLDSILLFEDGELLERVGAVDKIEARKGKFALSDSDPESMYVHFTSTDSSDPRQNEKTYRVYYPLVVASRSSGVFYLAMFLLGLGVFLYYRLRTVDQRQKFLVALREDLASVLVNTRHWPRLILSVAACSYLYVFMEWLFFITKPSFLDILGIVEKLGVLLLTGLVLCVLGIIALLVAALLDSVLLYLRLSKSPVLLEVFVPAAILAATALLLLDNFTYVLFKFGIVSTQGVWRTAYGLIFLAFVVYFRRQVLTFLGLSDKKSPSVSFLNHRFFRYAMMGLLLSSVIFALAVTDFSVSGQADDAAGNSRKIARQPNILLLASDGLSVDHMSVYGYERDTTPTLTELAQYSLVAENAFTNSGNSTGSTISIFTGKLPTQTRVLFPPNILSEADAYEHLPGILRREGYKTVEIAMVHYVDSYDVNLQNGFDISNGRSLEGNRLVQFMRRLGYADAAYFVGEISGRVSDRLLHIFYIRKMENLFQVVTQPSKEAIKNDLWRVDQLLDLLEDSDQPLFVHMHLLGTHGPKFYPLNRVFSNGQTQDEDWMDDFYDDAILDFDTYVGQILDALRKNKQADNTLLIIYTDHGEGWGVVGRIPLMVHFPGDAHAGRLQNNVQNLDISPTILDYLGLEQPEWMGGQSLLQGEPDPYRLIFNVGARNVTKPIGLGLTVLDNDRLAPPFYQFGHIVVLNCQKWRQLNLQTLKWYSGMVSGHTAPCDPNSLYTDQQLKDILIDHLAGQGFDVSSLRK